MRVSILLTCLMLLGSYSNASTPNLRLAYYGPYLNQYGLSIGADFDRLFWLSGDDYVAHKNAWTWSPQVAFFVRSNTHQNWMANVDFGRKVFLKNDITYRKIGVGAGYQLSKRILSSSVDLATGELTKTSTLVHYFIPTVFAEFGWETDRRFDWYGKAYYGRRISSGREDSAFPGLEIGVHFKLNNGNE